MKRSVVCWGQSSPQPGTGNDNILDTSELPSRSGGSIPRKFQPVPFKCLFFHRRCRRHRCGCNCHRRRCHCRRCYIVIVVVKVVIVEVVVIAKVVVVKVAIPVVIVVITIVVVVVVVIRVFGNSIYACI